MQSRLVPFSQDRLCQAHSSNGGPISRIMMAFALVVCLTVAHLPGKLMRAAKLVMLTKRGDVLHLRNRGAKAFVTRIVPIQLTSICLSNGSIVLPNSTSPVARMPALFTTASNSVVRCCCCCCWISIERLLWLGPEVVGRLKFQFKTVF